MIRRRSTALLAGLLVASVLAVTAVGVGAASPADAAETDVSAHATVDVTVGPLSVQTAENGSERRANATIAHEGERVTLTNAEGEIVQGEANLTTGARVYVEVESEDPETPVLVSGEARVDGDGTFATRLDLSDVPADTAVTVTISNESTTLASADGEVLRCTEDCTIPDELPEFERGVVDGARGEEFDVAVEVPDAIDRPVNLTIGDEESNFLVEVAAVDTDGDGEIVLTLNSTIAGNGSPSEYLSAGEDEIVNTRQRSEERSWPLEAGHYDLSIGPREAPYDLGTLAIMTQELDSSGPEETPSDVAAETTGEVTFITAGDTLELDDAENRTIRAETDLSPGTDVGLRIVSQDAENPFLFTPETTVTDAGTLNATVDLSDVASGTPFEVIAHHDGEAVGATLGRVVDCDERCQQEREDSRQVAVDESVERDTSETNGSAGTDSNTVEVDDPNDGSLPVGGLAAIGVGGLLAILGLAYFTGLLKG